MEREQNMKTNGLLEKVDRSEQRPVAGWFLLLTVCAVGIGGTFQYGYNLSFINAPTMHIQKFVNESWLENRGTQLESWTITLIWSIIVSVYPLGGFIGALIAGPMAVRLGRKKSLLINNLFVVLSAILCGFSRYASSFEMIILGRVLSGVNSGVSMNIQPMYLGESAPRHLRGTVALSSAVFTALGLVLGQVVGLREILGSEEFWPLLLASNVVPAILQLLFLPWLPESPRYLLIDLNDKDSCVQALQRLRGKCDFSIELEEMMAEQAAMKGQSPKGLFDVVRDPCLRKQLLIILVLSSAMQLCGNDSMYFYASYIFAAAGIPYEKIQYVVIGTGSCELLTSITSTMFIDRIGRRVLVIGGYSLMSVWAVVFMVALSYQAQVSWIPYLSMVCIFSYILSFGIGPAGVTGLIPSEIYDHMARPAAYMIYGSLMWIMLFVTGLAFPFIVQGLGHFCFIPFLIVCVSTALYVGFFLPETKGKSILEITEAFTNHRAKPHHAENGYRGPQEIQSTSL
ncbi:solute carrier family 2, facilitated glucose transporter member 11 [Pseudophryne corroboree]|uniref:solute carrier family 2, facilitated glucose transporter member 11 n=1 Tax=Pseudophryne corroboree TaxID=495146 RepID=UPI003081EDF2